MHLRNLHFDANNYLEAFILICCKTSCVDSSLELLPLVMFPSFWHVVGICNYDKTCFSMYSKSHDFNAYNVAITLPILMLKGFYWIWHYCFRIWMHNQFEHVGLHVNLCLKLKKVNLPIKLCILNIQDWCIGIMTFDHQQVPF